MLLGTNNLKENINWDINMAFEKRKLLPQVNVIIPIQLIRGFPSKITRKIFKSLTSFCLRRERFSNVYFFCVRIDSLAVNFIIIKLTLTQKLMESAMQRDVHNKSSKMFCKKDIQAYLYYIDS